MCHDCNPQANMSARIQLGSALAAARIAADRLDGLVPIVARCGAPITTATSIRHLVNVIKNHLLECERARAVMGLQIEDPRD